MKECPQGCLGEDLSRQWSLQMYKGRRVSVFKEESGGRCDWRSKKLKWDPMMGQILWASRMLEGGWFYLSRIWSYRMIWTEEELVWLLSRSIGQAAVQSQEVKGEGGAEEPEGNSAGSRVGMLLLVWGVSREDEWVDSWSIPKMRFTAFPSEFNLSYEKEWKRIAKFEICN